MSYEFVARVPQEAEDVWNSISDWLPTVTFACIKPGASKRLLFRLNEGETSWESDGEIAIEDGCLFVTFHIGRKSERDVIVEGIDSILAAHGVTAKLEEE